MDKNELESVMRKHGDTQETLAHALGISRACLNSKINERNGAEFNQTEIHQIKVRYEIDSDRLVEIFFNKNVS